MRKIQLKNDEQLEAKAEEFLAEFGKYDGRSLMLELVIQLFGYEIFPVPGLGEIAEAYLPITGKRIFVDEAQYSGASSLRWRFTLAEELAHAILHRPQFDGLSIEEAEQFRDSITDLEYLAIEREAKHFAGCLLMKRVEFLRRFAHFWRIQTNRNLNELVILRFVIRQLHFDFQASSHAVALRALKLKLIDQQQFDDLLESYSS